MKNFFKYSCNSVFALVLCIVIFGSPLTALAQETVAVSGELTATIRSEILKDPRAQDIPQEQLDAMVSSLAQAAASQGVSAQDILWQPTEARPEPVVETCGFLCYVNRIFGFSAGEYLIPLILGAASGFLILVISMMLHRHHAHGVEPTIEAIHAVPPTPQA